MSEHRDLTRFESLVALISELRGPQGCPWDRKQTHSSLREHLLEETYEVLEALDGEDTGELCAELGDLLMQIVFHAEIGREQRQFDIGDVIQSINRKLIHRHPHVFGGEQVENADEVLVKWEELKKQERRPESGMLDGVPKSLPALAYSQSVQDRVARVGFDWPDDDGVMEKLAEEVGEFQGAASTAERSEEFGDILFTLANLARRQGIDPETALREANAKFFRRFSAMEENARVRGLNLAELTLNEQNRLWDEVKGTETGQT